MNDNIKRGRIAIQCPAANGEFGTFLFVAGTMPREPVSPVFASLVGLYDWLAGSTWVRLPYDPEYPTGVYASKEEPAS